MRKEQEGVEITLTFEITKLRLDICQLYRIGAL
jgi:hypothetical protein